LPTTDQLGAKHIAENLRQAVELLAIQYAKSKVSDIVTISLGIATTIPTPDQLVANLSIPPTMPSIKQNRMVETEYVYIKLNDCITMETMRLSNEQIQVLKKTLSRLDSDARLYLFGSRVDDHKKGGDIDLLIESKKMTQADIRRLRLDFFAQFGEQKVDVLLDDGKKAHPFIKKIQQHAIEL